MAMPSAADAAKKWSQNLGAAQPRYVSGVNAVTTAPNQLAAAAADRYVAGVQANVPKYVANNQAVSLGDWKSATTGKGAQRLASGAAAAEPKVVKVYTQLFPYIEQVRTSLPPRGDLEQNIARAGAFARGMARFTKS